MLQSEWLNRVRTANPLVLNITNEVTTQFAANGLLALGASPIMSNAPQEMDELATIASAVVINIGTLNMPQITAMLAAGKAANRAGIPVILDPVGIGASRFRRETAEQLLSEIRFAVIRGNAGEIAALAGVNWQAKGVDVGSGSADSINMTDTAAKRLQTTVFMSGETDIVADGNRTAAIRNGTPLFPHITGSGCLLSAVCGAFAAVAEQQFFSAAVTAATAYGIAGELAAQGLMPTQTGTFAVRLLDSLAALNIRDIQQSAKVSL